MKAKGSSGEVKSTTVGPLLLLPSDSDAIPSLAAGDFPSVPSSRVTGPLMPPIMTQSRSSGLGDLSTSGLIVLSGAGDWGGAVGGGGGGGGGRLDMADCKVGDEGRVEEGGGEGEGEGDLGDRSDERRLLLFTELLLLYSTMCSSASSMSASFCGWGKDKLKGIGRQSTIGERGAQTHTYLCYSHKSDTCIAIANSNPTILWYFRATHSLQTVLPRCVCVLYNMVG